MTKLNFRINPSQDYLYDQVTTQITPIQERQSSPAHPRRNRTLSGASSSLASSSTNGSAGPLFSEIEMHSQNNGKTSYWSKPRRGRRRRGDTTTTTRDETLFASGNDDLFFEEESSSTSSSSLEGEEREYSSNERLLLVAFVSFMTFSVTQLYFAFRAESEAMKGDSAAMMVDSLTYLFNWIAERQKHTFDRNYQDPNSLTPERARQLRQRTKRKVTLQWEIIPPLISVSTLLVVTGVVLRQSLRVIWLDLHRDPNLQSDPNIDLMMAFALVNLVLDGVNFCCFAQASHLFGYDTMEDARMQSSSSVLQNHHPDGGNGHVALDMSESEEYDDDEDFMRELHRHNHQHANLNMCSAYTHVFADTLRSVAVILASALAEIFDDVTAEEADAAAALVVSLLILLSLVPLFQGLRQSARELWAIRAEERSETMLDEIKQEEQKRRDRFWSGGRGGEQEWTS